MKPHLYYALRHFCNTKRDYDHGRGEDWWDTRDEVCRFEVDHWECEGDEYRQKFTYHYKTLDRPLSIIDNYHTQKLYEWLIKR